MGGRRAASDVAGCEGPEYGVPGRIAPVGRMVLFGALVALAPTFPSPLAGQELPLKAVLPDPSPGGCYGQPDFQPVAPPETDAQEADRLSAAATQAAILGDQDGARDFLERAADLDPTDEGILYELARTYEGLGRSEDAVAAYCRYLSLATDATDAADVRVQVRRLNPPDTPLPVPAVTAFERGVTAFERGDLADAGEAFSSAISSASDLAPAYYNRALVRSAARQYDLAIEDFRRYLDLAPEARDAARVLERIGTLRNPPVVYNPTTALVAGVFIPGFGQFHTDRPVGGLLVLTAAAAAAGFGALYAETEVLCRTPEDPCPPNQIIEETTTRPLLAPGLGAAAGIALVAAIEGFVKAKSLNEEAATVVGAGEFSHRGVGVLWPAASAAVDGRVTLELLRFRF